VGIPEKYNQIRKTQKSAQKTKKNLDKCAGSKKECAKIVIFFRENYI
jgi:hypothetical protein